MQFLEAPLNVALKTTIITRGGEMKKKIIFMTLSFAFSSLFALPFNSKLSESEIEQINNGQTVIRNIDYSKNMSLDENYDETTKSITADFKSLNPKYLAEIIATRDYEGSEDLPNRLNAILLNISDYAGIPYWSEHNQKYFDLYSEAKIADISRKNNKTFIKAELIMEPFGEVDEDIEITKADENLFYTAYNTNTLKCYGFNVVSQKKLQMRIYLFRYEDKWIMYGIGGVNAPHIPFLTDRIRTSFINRINTFCTFIFAKF